MTIRTTFSTLLAFVCCLCNTLLAGNWTIDTNTQIRLLPSYNMQRIDSMVAEGIRNHIFPGCQVLALHHNDIIFYQNYGSLCYDTCTTVNDQTMYDVASMTKSLATTMVVMKLYDDGILHLQDSVGNYLSYTHQTPLAFLQIDELLTHTSGLVAFIPFYKSIADSMVAHQYSDIYSIRVTDNFYLRNDIPIQFRKKIASTSVVDKKYVYSDLNFILLKDIVETLLAQPMEDFLAEWLYRPMGLHHTCFNPGSSFSVENIAPTENDKTFRHQLVRGYVHDQSAAVLGGNGGNAGLFSNAMEISKLLTMLMNGGQYAGERYLSDTTVKKFTSTYPLHGCKRRALGFDTPSFDVPSGVLPSQCSRFTFGHQGFTGTVFWCDPRDEVVYIFLSNRVYPDAYPNALSRSRLRVKLHEEIYDGLGYK